MLFVDWQPSIEAFSIGDLSFRWYSLLWCIGLVFAYAIVQRLYKQQRIPDEKFDPLFFYCFIGILAGARLGHCIFYQPEDYLTSVKGVLEMLLPLRFATDSWSFEFRGYEGLASHGGAAGLALAVWFYAKKTGVRLLHVLDNIAIATPITACCIRLGNLMNSEIIGTPTQMPWGFVFHTPDALVDGQLAPRHPAQLYEALAYLVIFIIGIMIYRNELKNSKAGKNMSRVGSGFYLGFCIAAIFTFRFFVEFLKKEQVDFEEGMILDMGQLLSIPFIIAGVYFMIRRKWKSSTPMSSKMD